MHAHDENFLVVGTIEDADASALRNLYGVAPQEIVRKLLVGGLLERDDVAPLRIDARHDVLDRAVLARRVHRLEDQQHGPGILRVEHVLLHREPFRAALEKLGRLLLVHLEPERVAGIEVLQAEVLALRDAERIGVFPYRVEDVLDAASKLFLPSGRQSVLSSKVSRFLLWRTMSIGMAGVDSAFRRRGSALLATTARRMRPSAGSSVTRDAI